MRIIYEGLNIQFSTLSSVIACLCGLIYEEHSLDVVKDEGLWSNVVIAPQAEDRVKNKTSTMTLYSSPLPRLTLPGPCVTGV